ncbi:MAG: hypothetical protein LBH77_09135, partial [Tannerella sp.]|nr:hypothetical protein [Tannerella sp.]
MGMVGCVDHRGRDGRPQTHPFAGDPAYFLNVDKKLFNSFDIYKKYLYLCRKFLTSKMKEFGNEFMR